MNGLQWRRRILSRLTHRPAGLVVAAALVFGLVTAVPAAPASASSGHHKPPQEAVDGGKAPAQRKVHLGDPAEKKEATPECAVGTSPQKIPATAQIPDAVAKELHASACSTRRSMRTAAPDAPTLSSVEQKRSQEQANAKHLRIQANEAISVTGSSSFESPDWHQAQPASSPTGTSYNNDSSAYDPVRQQTVLVQACPGSGGFTTCTWLWNGLTWQQATNEGSLQNVDGNAALAWDPQLNEVIATGGDNGSTPTPGTFAWNGTTWTALSTSGAPSARSQTSMVWDSALNKMILFGGESSSGDLGDTWSFANNTWTLLSEPTAPSARMDALVTYDPSMQQVVLFGGLYHLSGAQYTLGDTWVLNSSGAWAKQSPSVSPPSRVDGGFAYDAALGASILYGGFGDSGGASIGPIYGDTWAWSGGNWYQAQTGIASPGQTYGVSIAPDSTGSLIMTGFGVGHGTYVYNASVPVLAASIVSPNRSAGATSDSVGDQVTVDVTASNPGPNPISGATVTTNGGSALDLGGSQVSTWSGATSSLPPLPLTSSTATSTCPLTGSGSNLLCAVVGLTEQATNVALPGGSSLVQQIVSTIASNVVGCAPITLPIVGTIGSLSSAPTQAQDTVCQGGLGMENWYSYDKTTAGPSTTASVNVANGNLVLQDQDSTEVGSHGQLGFSLERTYNSQDNMAQLLDENIGSGWQLNVGQTDEGTSGGLDVAGLEVPTVESALNPLAVTYIDRDGTRMVFQPRGISAGLGLGPLGAIDLSTSPPPNLLGLVTGLLKGNSLLSNLPTVLHNSSDQGYNLCLDATYSPPPGADLQLYRYIGVSASQGQAPGCTTANGLNNPSDPPVVVGWSVVRADRLRYDFSADGQLLSVTDAAGNEMKYGYELSPTADPLNQIATLGRLTSVTLGNTNANLQVCQSTASVPSPAACPQYKIQYNSPAAPTTTRVDVTDPAGRLTTYILDGDPLVNHLMQVWNPDNPYPLAFGTSAPQQANPSEGYTYDNSGACGPGLTSLPATSGLLCSVKDPDGQKTSFSYTTAPIGPDRVQTVIDRRANAAIASYGTKTGALNQTGSETVYTYNDAAAYTTVDSADPSVTGAVGANYAAPTGCVNNAKCERTRYEGIDAEGRVGEIDDGDASNNFLHQTGYFWDGDQVAACEQPDEVVDNDLCQKIVRGAVTTAPFVPDQVNRTTVNGVTVADQETAFTYSDTGQTLSKTVVRNPHPGWTNADADITTYGYHNQYFEADGSVHTFEDTPTGNGQVASGSSQSPLSYSAQVTADGAASYWKFDEPSGTTTAVDSIGHNNGTYGTPLNQGQAGPIAADHAVTTQATTGDVFSVANPSGFAPDSTSKFSVETWVKTTSTSEQLLLSDYDSKGTGYYLCLYNGYPTWVQASNSVAVSSDVLDVLGLTPVSDGTWHQIVVTGDGSGKAAGIKIYVDGNLAGNLVAANNLSGTTVPAAGTPLVYGWEGAAVPFQPGTGIDDTSVYNSTLTPAQVALHHALAEPSRADAATLYAVSDQVAMVSPRGNATGAPYGNYLTSYRRDIPAPGSSPYALPNSESVGSACVSATSGNTGLLCETDAPDSPNTRAPPAGCTAPTMIPFVMASLPGANPPTSAVPAPYTWSCTKNTYDAFGQKATMTTANEDAGLATGHYTYTYYQDTTTCSGAAASNCDLSGNVSAGGWLEAVTDPNGNSVVYAYDRAGNTARTWDRNATVGKSLSLNWESAASPPSQQYSESDYANPVTEASLAAGGNFSVVAKPDGSVWAWGGNDQGQLGNGTTTASNAPVQVKGLTHVTQVAATGTGATANETAYALAGGAVWAWGGNTYGELGNNSTTASTTPQKVQFTTKAGQGQPYIISVAANGYGAVALDAFGGVWTWGANNYGQAGNGSTSADVLTATQVPNLSGVASIGAGSADDYAVKTDGTVWAWGINNVGEIGNGTTTEANSPTQVPGITNAISVAGGYASAYAVRTDGTVAAWGYNADGELGNNSTTEANSPITVSGLRGVREIQAGYEDAIAVKQDNTVWGWGLDNVGQQGDNTNGTSRLIPAQINSVTNQTALSVGWGHVMTAGPDGTITAWGWNANGQLGNGTTAASGAPGTAATAGYLSPYSAPWRYKQSGRDAAGNRTAIVIDPDGNAVVTRPARGEAVYTTAYDTVDGNDAAGNPMIIQTPLERAGVKWTINGYDAWGNKTVAIDPDTDAVETDYDSVNRAVTTETDRGATSASVADAPTCQNQASATAAKDITAGHYYCQISTTYDGNDNKVTTTDADNVTTTTTYDGAGEKIQQQALRSTGPSPVTLTSGWNYDADGNAVDTCPPNEFDTASGNAPGSAGACTSSGIYSTHVTFDNRSKPIRSVQYRAAGQPLTTSTGYDADGNETSITDPNGFTATIAYDALDRQTTEVTPRTAGVTETEAWQHDPSGNVTAVIAPGNQDTGSGANGALVVDGSTASASTDGIAHPASNPFQIPNGAQYTTVTVQNGGAITAPVGVQTLNLYATGTVNICSNCTVTMAGSGYQGGAGASTGTGSPGTAPGGITTANGGASTSTAGGGGGGGGHNGAGTGGQTASQGGAGGTGGAGYGQTDFTVTPNYGVGSGAAGGGAGAAGSSGGAGGAGGGFIHLSAGGSVTVASGGQITAAGHAGAAGTGSGGGGGGGAGGGVWVQSPTINLPNGAANVTGGAGGTSSASDNGGAGANGYVQLDSGPAANSPGSKLNEVTEYAYDADNRTIDTVVGAQAVSADPTVDNGADAAADPGGGFNERNATVYDADGHIVATLPPNAFTGTGSVASPDWSYAQRTDYDLDGRPSAAYSPRYNAAHPDVASLNGDDGAGDQQTSECPTGADPQYAPGVAPYGADVGVCEVVTSYDPAGRKVRQTLPISTANTGNRYQAWTYTTDGLVSTVTGPDPSTAGGRVTTDAYLYDGTGRQTQDTEANGLVSTTSYTADGLTSQTSSCGGVKGDCSDSNVTHIVNSTYDANGQEIAQTDPNAQDPNGLAATVGGAKPTGPMTSDDYTTRTTWTPDGLKASVRAPGLGHGNFDVTTYVYDNDGNPLKTYSPSATARDATNPTGLPTTYAYTQDDLVASETVPLTASSSRVTTYRYGPAGQKVSTDVARTGSNAADSGIQTVAYLPDGLPTSETGHNGTGDITTVYDANGTPTTVTDTTSGIKVNASYYLDELDRNVSESGPVSSSQAFAYDGAGHLSVDVDQPGTLASATTTTSYGDAELATGQAWSQNPADATTWSYNNVGEPTSQVNAHQTESMSYNADGTLSSIANKGGASLLTDYAYTYDDDGNRLSQSTPNSPTATGADSGTHSYTYDPASNVTTFTDSDGTHTVGWDHDNNRVSESDPAGKQRPTATTTTTSYNADNSAQSETITPASGSSTTLSDSYSAAGDLLSDGCNQNTFDGFDRTASVTTSSGKPGCGSTAAGSSSYSYDGLDRQATETTGSTKLVNYYVGSGTALADQTSSAGTNLRYDLDNAGKPLELVVSGSSSSTNYLDTDGDGNVTNVVNAANGTATCDARYDPFGDPEQPTGNTVCNTGSSANILWYQGEARDPNTGEYQLGSRTYNPMAASFTTPDHYRVSGPSTDLAVGTDPLTSNTYTYVNGNPLNANDPNGHFGQIFSPVPDPSLPQKLANDVQKDQEKRAEAADNKAVTKELQGYLANAYADNASPSQVAFFKYLQNCKSDTVECLQAISIARGGSIQQASSLGHAICSSKKTFNLCQYNEGPAREDHLTEGVINVIVTAGLFWAVGGLASAIESLPEAFAGSAGADAGGSEAADLIDGEGEPAIEDALGDAGRSTNKPVAPKADDPAAPADPSPAPKPDPTAPKPTADTPAAPDDPAPDDTSPEGAKCGGESFTPDTSVRLASGGTVAIDKIKTGMKVLAENPKTGKLQSRVVTQTWINEDKDLYSLTVNVHNSRQIIKTTQHHLFYDLTTRRWTEAEQLRSGDRLVGVGSPGAVVVGGTVVPGAAAMWDLTVDGDHDFFVLAAADTVLVHNCPKLNPSSADDGSQAAEGARGFQGGRYRDLDARDGIERHHMPANSVSPLSRGAGPSIQMDAEDHELTASYQSSKSAIAYRAAQKALIGQGDFEDAVQMDIDDVTSLFPGKYDDAILQMIDSLPSSDEVSSAAAKKAAGP